VSYTATAKINDGSSADFTQKVQWSAVPASVLTISDKGQATGLTVGDATIRATVPGYPSVTAMFPTVVLPPDTYRLVGKVLESGLPVATAAVVILSGVGAGVSATTDAAGEYRVYGVAGPIQVKVTKAGYDDLVKTFTAVQNDVLDFPDAHQTAGIPSLTGTYTLTVTADPACATYSSRAFAGLPADFLQPRSYAVSVTQDGPTVTVTLTGGAIVPQDNHFTGRIGPDSIDFSIGWGYFGYGLDDGVAEQVSATQTFVFGGQLHGQRSGSTITARLDGALEVYLPFPGSPGNYTLSAQCIASNSAVTLTPVARPAHR
jgi:hypothetical protein